MLFLNCFLVVLGLACGLIAVVFLVGAIALLAGWLWTWQEGRNRF